jgi:hypothetical protein
MTNELKFDLSQFRLVIMLEDRSVRVDLVYDSNGPNVHYPHLFHISTSRTTKGTNSCWKSLESKILETATHIMQTSATLQMTPLMVHSLSHRARWWQHLLRSEIP